LTRLYSFDKCRQFWRDSVVLTTWHLGLYFRQSSCRDRTMTHVVMDHDTCCYGPWHMLFSRQNVCLQDTRCLQDKSITYHTDCLYKMNVSHRVSSHNECVMTWMWMCHDTWMWMCLDTWMWMCHDMNVSSDECECVMTHLVYPLYSIKSSCLHTIISP